jgi:hypothetical protein
METIECPFCTAAIPAHARKCKHCGEWVNEPNRGAPRAEDDQRVVCRHCQKKMVPRVITGPPLVRPQHGWTPVPKKSVCPFCGGTHMTFPASLGQKIAATVLTVVVVVILGVVAVYVLGK